MPQVIATLVCGSRVLLGSRQVHGHRIGVCVKPCTCLHFTRYRGMYVTITQFSRPLFEVFDRVSIAPER